MPTVLPSVSMAVRGLLAVAAFVMATGGAAAVAGVEAVLLAAGGAAAVAGVVGWTVVAGVAGVADVAVVPVW